jgi:hypothetical protein
MSDIVERLRSWARTALDKTEDAGPLATLREAAAELERLRAERSVLRTLLRKMLEADPYASVESFWGDIKRALNPQEGDASAIAKAEDGK